jgi:glycosyltransferase involved in cell wall biosynthesis/uncharacterized protein involved in exopolysaccharide biosynthesis
MIGGLVISAVLITGIVSKLSPKLYEAKATLMPVREEPMGGGISFGGGKEKGGGASSLMMDGLSGRASGPTVMDTLTLLLNSRRMTEAVVEQLNLREYYGTTSKTAASNALRNETTIKQSAYKSLEIIVLTHNSKVAADIANAYVSNLDRLNMEFSMTMTKRNRLFMEARLAEKTKKLDEMENDLKVFQIEHHLLGGSEEGGKGGVGGPMEAAIALHSNIVSLEVELAALKEYALPNHPLVTQIQAQIKELGKQLDKLEQDEASRSIAKRRTRPSLSQKVFPLVEEAPTLFLDLLRLTRRVKVEEAVYGMLVGSLEAARLMEAKNLPTIQPMDLAVPPEFHSRPKTLQSVQVAGALSLALGCLLVIFVNYLQRLKAEEAAALPSMASMDELAAGDVNGNGSKLEGHPTAGKEAERFRQGPWRRRLRSIERRPLKIIRVIGRLNIGGPAVHAVLLTAGLNDDSFRSTLVAGSVGSSEGDMLYFARQHGVNPVIVPALGREISWRDDLVAFWKLYRLFVWERPDIVHTHTAKAGVLGRLAAVLAGVPIRIHTFHGHVFHGYFGFLRTNLFLMIERFLAYFTTRIVAISTAQLAELSDRYRIARREKFAVIPLGLDLTPLLQIGRKGGSAKPGANEKAITIGLIGRLVPIKNPQMAVAVLHRLRERVAGLDVVLVVAGDGELKSELQNMVGQAGLDGRVLFTGWKEDLSELYARLDLVIITSLNEGTPVVLIEAMASALPFVATRVGGIPDLMVGAEEVVHGPGGQPLFSLFANGALVEAGNVEGFTAALDHILQNEAQRRGMGAVGRSFVSERFSKERLVHDTYALYQDCLQYDTGWGRKQAAPYEAGEALSSRKTI